MSSLAGGKTELMFTADDLWRGDNFATTAAWSATFTEITDWCVAHMVAPPSDEVVAVIRLADGLFDVVCLKRQGRCLHHYRTPSTIVWPWIHLMTPQSINRFECRECGAGVAVTTRPTPAHHCEQGACICAPNWLR